MAMFSATQNKGCHVPSLVCLLLCAYGVPAPSAAVMCFGHLDVHRPEWLASSDRCLAVPVRFAPPLPPDHLPFPLPPRIPNHAADDHILHITILYAHNPPTTTLFRRIRKAARRLFRTILPHPLFTTPFTFTACTTPHTEWPQLVILPDPSSPLALAIPLLRQHIATLFPDVFRPYTAHFPVHIPYHYPRPSAPTAVPPPPDASRKRRRGSR